MGYLNSLLHKFSDLSFVEQMIIFNTLISSLHASLEKSKQYGDIKSDNKFLNFASKAAGILQAILGVIGYNPRRSGNEINEKK